MNKAVSLFILSQSMTKAEKRYFRLSANLQGGEKIYLTLFDLFDQSASLEEAADRFCREFPERSLEPAVKYLYTSILESLVRLRAGQDAQSRIFDLISATHILSERGLYPEALRELERAKRLAETHQQDVLLLLIRQTELRLLGDRNFSTLDEEALVGKQIRIIDLLKRIRNVNWHAQLYDILKYRFHHKGYVRSTKEKEGLNDLLLHELNLVANAPSRRFETEEVHALFQATYFLSIGNYRAALGHYRWLIGRLEQGHPAGTVSTAHYLQALLGILDTLLATGLYDEIPYFAGKLAAAGATDSESALNNLAWQYLYNSSALIHTGRFEEALALKAEFDEPLLQKAHLLGLGLQLRLRLHLTTLLLAVGRLPEAKKQMHKILSSGKLLHAFPIYKAARMVNLILQAETGDYDAIHNETASIRREIRLDKRQRLYAAEKLLLRFLQSYPLPYDKAHRKKLWQKFAAQAQLIRRDKYERSILVIFDFPAWIESRLTGRPLSEVLSEEAAAETAGEPAGKE